MPNLDFERELCAEGHRIVAGIDEAGRGPLAGPVMAAAVILPDGFEHAELNDSKLLSARKREAIYEEITLNDSIIWAFASAEVEEIDRINILQATYVAMRRALKGLSRIADAALIDGRPVPDFPIPHRALVKGDSRSLSIAAASIVAKVERDRMMIKYAARWPEYGFDSHKGYGTKAHLEALGKHGPCEIHRCSFAPVAQARLRFGNL